MNMNQGYFLLCENVGHEHKILSDCRCTTYSIIEASIDISPIDGRVKGHILPILPFQFLKVSATWAAESSKTIPNLVNNY